MSQYADYLRERTNDEILEKEYGFATYRFIDPLTVYIIDVYIVPELRRHGAASNIGDDIVKIAKLRGCTKLLGSVVPSAKGSTESIKFLLSYGMKVKSSGPDWVFFEKDI